MAIKGRTAPRRDMPGGGAATHEGGGNTWLGVREGFDPGISARPMSLSQSKAVATRTPTKGQYQHSARRVGHFSTRKPVAQSCLGSLAGPTSQRSLESVASRRGTRVFAGSPGMSMASEQNCTSPHSTNRPLLTMASEPSLPGSYPIKVRRAASRCPAGGEDRRISEGPGPWSRSPAPPSTYRHGRRTPSPGHARGGRMRSMIASWTVCASTAGSGRRYRVRLRAGGEGMHGGHTIHVSAKMTP